MRLFFFAGGSVCWVKLVVMCRYWAFIYVCIQNNVRRCIGQIRLRCVHESTAGSNEHVSVSQFQDGVWTLSTNICDYLMTMDVMLCTASIFNLCAISVDRSVLICTGQTDHTPRKLWVSLCENRIQFWSQSSVWQAEFTHQSLFTGRYWGGIVACVWKRKKKEQLCRALIWLEK